MSATVYISTEGFTADVNPQFIIKVTNPANNQHTYYFTHAVWSYSLKAAVDAGNDEEIAGCEAIADEFDAAKAALTPADPVVEAVLRGAPPSTDPPGTHTDDGG